MKPTQTYYTTGAGAGHPNPATIAHTLRIGRLELCCAWMRGYVPSWFYFLRNGKLHPGAVSLTFRAYRVMLGYRWYTP